MPERAQIFAACGKIILQVFNKPSESVDKTQLQAVADARKCTLAIIQELAIASENDTQIPIAKQAEAALSDLHPAVPYNCYEKLIRDLGELCATFRTIENGGERSSRERVFEAKIFCDHMKEELSALKS